MPLANEMRRLTKGFVDAFDDRIANVMSIRTNTAEDLSGFHNAHERMAAQQRQQLADYVGTLRDNMATMLKSLDTAHSQMATELSKQMTAVHARLVKDVSNMRADFQKDQNEARKIWNSFNTLMQRRRAKKFSTAPQKASEKVTTTLKAPGKVTTTPDDFTTINGIGPARVKQLKKVGIHTFRQLAGSTPAKIRTAMGKTGNMANVEQWIKDAKKRNS